MPSLLGVGKTAPFFHENSATTLTAAVQFYDSTSFNGSPASQQIGGIGGAVNAITGDLVAFLTVVGEEPETPVISGITASQNQPTLTSLHPFPNVTITDATTPAQTLTITVLIDNAAKGPLSGFTANGPGAWTFSGTAAAATTALRARFFDHALERGKPGSTEITRFMLGVNDGVAETVWNDSTTIISTTITAPSISVIANVSTLMNTALPAVAFTVAGLDTLASNYTLTATSGNAAVISNDRLSLGGAGASRSLNLVPVADATGSADITVTATQGALTATCTFTLTVAPFQSSFGPSVAGAGSLNSPPCQGDAIS